MTKLFAKAAQIRALFPTAVDADYRLIDDGDGAGPYIDVAAWNAAKLGALPVPQALSAIDPALTELKAAKLADATGYFAQLFLLPHGFTWNGHPYQIDQAGLFNIMAVGADADRAIAGGAVWDPGFVFIDARNAEVPMKALDARAFSQATMDYVRACRLRFRTTKNAINAAADAGALAAIDVTSGYPIASA